MMHLFRALMVLAILACLTPLFGVLATAVISDLYGCVVDETQIRECLIAGRDIGREFHTIGTMGWMLMLTFPAMLAVLVLWLVVEMRRLYKRWLRTGAVEHGAALSGSAAAQQPERRS